MPVMKPEYTAIIKQDNDWWIGWIEEVTGVNCQEKSRELLIDSLRVTLQEALDFNVPFGDGGNPSSLDEECNDDM